MKSKRLLSILLAVVMLVGLLAMPVDALEYGEEWSGSSTVYTKKFTDLPANHWAYQNVMYVVAKGWFNGYPDETFHPNDSLTRAEALAVFVQFLSLELKDVTTPTFYDVDVNKWYTPYIEAGKDLLPVHNNFDNSKPFRPDMPVTREDIMYALVIGLNYASDVKFVNESVLNMFKDQNSISSDIRPYIAWAVQEGMVAGNADGTIGAQDPLTRAQFATLLSRAAKIGPGPKHKVDGGVITSVSVTPTGRKELKTGESFSIEATATYSDKSTKEYTEFTPYNSDDNGVVSINGGKVTAEKPGNCTIKFKFKDDQLQKDQSIVVIVTQDSGEVTLNFSQYDNTTYEQFVTITGSAKDQKGDKVTLTCNNKPVPLENDGSFTYTVPLNMGRNTLEFVAKNSAGTSNSKSIEITRMDVGQVSISIDDYSSSTDSDKITLSGKVINTGSGKSTLRCNGQNVTLDGNGSFSFEVDDLQIGNNTFDFEAENEAGVKTTKSITIVRKEKEEPLPPPPQPSYKDWKKTDSRWSSVGIGSGRTLGSSGGLVVSLAIAMVDCGIKSESDFSPATLVELLNQHGGLNSSGQVVWGNVSKAVPGFNEQANSYMRGRPLSIGDKVSIIRSLVDKGYEVIVQIPGGSPWGLRYVVVDRVEGDTVYMFDPCTDETDLFGTYGNYPDVAIPYSY